MALDGTYAGLKASVADWLNRADLTAVVPDFITLAEAATHYPCAKKAWVEFLGERGEFAGVNEQVSR